MVLTTHIGSLPFKDIQRAIDFNKKFTLPVLATLPLLQKNEFMINQVLDGIQGYKYKNYKIFLDKKFSLKEHRFPFIMEKEFIQNFKRHEIKWQVVGIVTLLKSIVNLKISDQSRIVNWHLKNIINYHKYLSGYFPLVHLFLDEPLYNDIADKKLLISFLEKLKVEEIKINLHCCGSITHELFTGLLLSGLSFDYTQLTDIDCLELKRSVQRLYLGVINTMTLRCVNEIPLSNVDFLTPACGLAYSNPEMVLNIPNLLNARTECS